MTTMYYNIYFIMIVDYIRLSFNNNNNNIFLLYVNASSNRKERSYQSMVKQIHEKHPKVVHQELGLALIACCLGHPTSEVSSLMARDEEENCGEKRQQSKRILGDRAYYS